MKAAAHPRQSARLAALRAYDILDTPRESDFDDIVELASQICAAPISVVNLIDAERQWFKAEVGLGVRETPLDTSICSHVILEHDFVEIPDTLRDARMQDNALCLGDPGLRFYAGALLKTGDGLPLGTLCVLDYEPRTLTPLQRHALTVLARQVMGQLDLRLALARKALLQKEVDHRVKNSLQAVAAMVRLQLRAAEDPALRAALENVEQRVRSVALIHEELYRTSSLDVVDLGHYVTRLGELLYAGAPPSVAISVAVHVGEPLGVNASRASSVGIIVNEFVFNALKHAFPDERPGSISIALRDIDAGAVELRCEDDGAGHSGADSSGLGLRLIEAAAAQIGGRAEFLRDGPGFALRVAFPR